MTSPTMRDVLYRKLESFYQKHDPDKLNTNFDATVNYGLTEGLSALNAGLMAKYGDYLDSGAEAANVVEHHEEDREFLRGRIELYYLKHDPAKLDKAADIESILEWTVLYGVDELNKKLIKKYEEDFYQPSQKDAERILAQYYEKYKVKKTPQDIQDLVNWGMQYSFCELNESLVKKYGAGLGATNIQKMKDDLKVKLGNFYAVYDSSQLDDPDSMNHILEWVIKYGEENLNKKLHKKYGANLNTIPHAPKGDVQYADYAPNTHIPHAPGTAEHEHIPHAPGKPEPHLVEDGIPYTRDRSTSNISEMSARAANMNEEEIHEEVMNDEEKVNNLKTLGHYFYAKYDQDKLYSGGVSALVDTALTQGEIVLNDKLKGLYGVDLVDLEEEYEIIEEKLVLFYTLYDPEKLDKSIESIIGWAIVHGEPALNAKLMEKYDDDLESTGLKIRLRMFYKKVGEPKSETDLSNIAGWAMRKGIHRLNKRMKKKYDMCLEDLFIGEEPAGEEYGDEVYDDEEGAEDDTEDDAVFESQAGSSYVEDEEDDTVVEAERVQVETSTDRFLADTDSDTNSNADDDNVDGDEEDPLENSMVTKLQRFYAKHDPSKGENGKVVRQNIEYILTNGLEAFNRILLEKYGESLNSLLGRRKTLAKFKADQRNSSKTSSQQQDEEARANMQQVL